MKKHYVFPSILTTELFSKITLRKIQWESRSLMPYVSIHTCPMCTYIHALCIHMYTHVPYVYIHTCPMYTYVYTHALCIHMYTHVPYVYTRIHACPMCTYTHALCIHMYTYMPYVTLMPYVYMCICIWYDQKLSYAGFSL